MVTKTLLRVALAGIFVTCAAVAASAQATDPDDVAAAARKARDQQKTAPKPKKVVTNDDIPSKSTAPDAAAKPATPGEGGQAEGQASNGAPKDEDDPKKEAYWHKRYSEIHDKLTQAEKDLDVYQRELNTDQVQYYNDPQKALVEQHNRTEINDKTAKVDAKKKEVQGLKQQLTDLEEECRKSGCDPGWVR